ncbi:hypothetical protein [Chitinophaga flava]|uniref:hypothetical protein n=1 Tax=Chitinophaga flava TaxID=2259036 RepID=UPI0011BDBD1E|nr:hypothetical protein [Chitinophaga flava]
MNKAKFLLSAVALVAVIGAITSSVAQPNQRIHTTDVPGPCTATIAATLAPNSNFLFNTYASLDAVCPDKNDVYISL